MSKLTPEEQEQLMTQLSMIPSATDLQWIETATWAHCEWCQQMYTEMGITEPEWTNGKERQDDLPALSLDIIF